MKTYTPAGEIVGTYMVPCSDHLFFASDLLYALSFDATSSFAACNLCAVKWKTHKYDLCGDGCVRVVFIYVFFLTNESIHQQRGLLEWGGCWASVS